MYKGFNIIQSLTSDLDDGRTLHLKFLNLVFPGSWKEYGLALQKQSILALLSDTGYGKLE